MDQVPPLDWTRQGDALVRTFHRADFIDALGFVASVAQLAQAADHHPDIDLRYNKVHLRLQTHSAGHKVTSKDFQLAEQINHLSEGDIREMTEDLRKRLSL